MCGRYRLQSLGNSGEGRAGNGIRFDSNENMFIADYKGHNILHYNMIRVATSCYVHFLKTVSNTVVDSNVVDYI